MHIERKVVQYTPGTHGVVKKDLLNDLELCHILGVEFSLIDGDDVTRFMVEIGTDGLRVRATCPGKERIIIKPESGVNVVTIWAERG